MTRKATVSALLLGLSGFLIDLEAGEPFQYWLTLNSKKFGLGADWESQTHVQLRSPEMDFLQYGRVSQKFLRPLSDVWSLGLHPAIEFNRPASSEPWREDYRLEVELSSKLALWKSTTFSARNRWEFRLREGNSDEIVHRFRQLTRLSWPLESRFFSGISVANEAFYDVSDGFLAANRFFPISLTLNTGTKPTFSTYLMYLSSRPRSTSPWQGSYVVGLNLVW